MPIRASGRIISTIAAAHPEIARRIRGERARSLERQFGLQLRAAGLTSFQPQVVFWPGRQWRLDWGDPLSLIGVEINGGTWLPKGAHNTGAGLARDYEKWTRAALLGWRLVFFDAQMVKDGRAIAWLEDLCGRSDARQTAHP